MRILIAGCGYVGTALGTALVGKGHEVWGMRRSENAGPELESHGIKFLRADMTRTEDLAAAPTDWDAVVNAASSARGGIEEYRAIYLTGMRNLVNWLKDRPPRRFIYTSSTGVYAQNDGSLIKETSPAEGTGDTGGVLVEAEQILLEAWRESKFPAVILRVAGIYGPNRTYFLNQFLEGKARIPGKGDRHMNMIHLDDLVVALATAVENGRAGEIYNVVDDEPVMQVHFYRWLSEALGKPMPSFVPEAVEPDRKRAATNKKISNRKFKMELGCPLKYPNFRKGYTAEIQRLDQEGKLNLGPEPRGPE